MADKNPAQPPHKGEAFDPAQLEQEKLKPSARRDEDRPADTYGVNVARGSETATRKASGPRG
ncbi:hypothetical protein [Parerythrobacter lacustris]|uniref:Uncharacterized protein n=1 Tax=Parerythrobacter lacustris TaxID=2969984 RepID=A0ABT1XSC1_9SPHN|nr:hypothetical protein [Parerythrobacter lacustris]MCR2834545.1 hypothetical protein [Parerythrobacter lacustris]